MEKGLEGNYNIRQIYGSTGEKCLCLSCNKEKHLAPTKIAQQNETNESSEAFAKKNDLVDHDFSMICEECEERSRSFYCNEGEEYLGGKCEKTIHNKGTRTLHERVPISHTEMYKILFNAIYVDPDIDAEEIDQLLEYYKHNYIGQEKYSVLYYGKNITDTDLINLSDKRIPWESECLNSKINLLSQKLGIGAKPGEFESGVNFFDIIINQIPLQYYLNHLTIISRNSFGETEKIQLKRRFLGSQLHFIQKSSRLDSGARISNIDNFSTHEPNNLVFKKESNEDHSDSKNHKLASSFTQKGSNESKKSKKQNTFHDDTPRLKGQSSNFQIENSSKSSLKDSGNLSIGKNNTGSKKYNFSSNNKPKLSHFISQNQTAQLSKSKITVSDYLEVYFGLKDKKFLPQNMKGLFQTLGTKPGINNGGGSSSGPGGSGGQLPIYHIFNDVYNDTQLTLNMSLKIQNTLKMFAEKGHILVDYNEFLKAMVECFEKTEKEVRDILLKAADMNIIIINSRQVTISHTLNFVSLKLEILAIENLYWVVKSLKLDKVTPIEDTIISRIKEAFELKIKRKSWKKLLQLYGEIINEYKLSKREDIPMLSDLTIEEKENPSLRNGKTYYFDLNSINVTQEDDIEIEDIDNDWIYFKKYIDSLFEEDLLLYNNMSTHQDVKKESGNDLDQPIGKYRETSTSNVDSNLYKEEVEEEEEQPNIYRGEAESKLYNSTQTDNSLLNNNSRFKAISGGRYGLAQFMKFFGPDKLKQLSVGRLIKLVQKAIDGSFLKYYKSFLMKSSESESNSQNAVKDQLKNENSAYQLKKIKEKIIEGLVENKNCIAFPQLIQILSKKLGFKLDIKELGFTKLTLFIEKLFTEDEIIIRSVDANNLLLTLSDRLYQEGKLKTNSGLDVSYKPILQDLSKDSYYMKNTISLENIHKRQNSYFNLMNKQFEKKPTNHSWNCNINDSAYNNSWADTAKNYGNISSMEGYRYKITNAIEEVMKNANGGIEISLMHKNLSEKLGVANFNPELFGGENLLTFLQTYYHREVSLEMGKNNYAGVLTVLVYTKNGKMSFLNKQRLGLDSTTKKYEPLKKGTMAKGLLNSSVYNLFGPLSTSKISNQKLSGFLNKTIHQNQRNEEYDISKNKAWSPKHTSNDVFNISYLDDLPSLISHRGNIHTDSIDQIHKMRDENHQNNHSTVEIKEFLEMLNKGPEIEQNDEFSNLTIFSVPREHSLSCITIPGDISSLANFTLHQNRSINHSRGLSLEKTGLKTVTETAVEKDKSDSNLNEDRDKEKEESSKNNHNTNVNSNKILSNEEEDDNPTSNCLKSLDDSFKITNDKSQYPNICSPNKNNPNGRNSNSNGLNRDLGFGSNSSGRYDAHHYGNNIGKIENASMSQGATVACNPNNIDLSNNIKDDAQKISGSTNNSSNTHSTNFNTNNLEHEPLGINKLGLSIIKNSKDEYVEKDSLKKLKMTTSKKDKNFMVLDYDHEYDDNLHGLKNNIKKHDYSKVGDTIENISKMKKNILDDNHGIEKIKTEYNPITEKYPETQKKSKEEFSDKLIDDDLILDVVKKFAQSDKDNQSINKDINDEDSESDENNGTVIEKISYSDNHSDEHSQDDFEDQDSKNIKNINNGEKPNILLEKNCVKDIESQIINNTQNSNGGGLSTKINCNGNTKIYSEKKKYKSEKKL